MIFFTFILYALCMIVSMYATHITAMKVTYFGQCQDQPVTPVLSKQGPTSLNICMTECAIRPACQMIGFASRAKICWLFNSTQLNRTSNTVVKNCMYIKKSDFDELQTQVPSTECTLQDIKDLFRNLKYLVDWYFSLH